MPSKRRTKREEFERRSKASKKGWRTRKTKEKIKSLQRVARGIKRAPVKRAPIKRALVKRAPVKRAPVKRTPVKRPSKAQALASQLKALKKTVASHQKTFAKELQKKQRALEKKQNELNRAKAQRAFARHDKGMAKELAAEKKRRARLQTEYDRLYGDWVKDTRFTNRKGEFTPAISHIRAFDLALQGQIKQRMNRAERQGGIAQRDRMALMIAEEFDLPVQEVYNFFHS